MLICPLICHLSVCLVPCHADRKFLLHTHSGVLWGRFLCSVLPVMVVNFKCTRKLLRIFSIQEENTNIYKYWLKCGQLLWSRLHFGWRTDQACYSKAVRLVLSSNTGDGAGGLKPSLNTVAQFRWHSCDACDIYEVRMSVYTDRMVCVGLCPCSSSHSCWLDLVAVCLNMQNIQACVRAWEYVCVLFEGVCAYHIAAG